MNDAILSGRKYVLITLHKFQAIYILPVPTYLAINKCLSIASVRFVKNKETSPEDEIISLCSKFI